MHQNGSDSRDFSGLNGAQYGVAQESRADSAALERNVNGEAADDHYRYGIGHIAADAASGLRVRNRARGEGIIPDDLFPIADDVRAGCSLALVFEGTAREPVVERRLATMKMRYVVLRGELLWRRKVRNYFSHGAFFRSRRASLGLGAGGLSSMAVKRRNSASSSWK